MNTEECSNVLRMRERTPDGYVVIRRSTLAWLIERHRVNEIPADVPEQVAVDLGEAVINVRAPEPDEERLERFGPLLSSDTHKSLLRRDVELPTDVAGRSFWELVVDIVHNMMAYEGEAIMRVVGGKDGD